MDSVVILAIQKLSGDNLRIHVWILRLSVAILGICGLRDASASKNRFRLMGTPEWPGTLGSEPSDQTVALRWMIQKRYRKAEENIFTEFERARRFQHQRVLHDHTKGEFGN